MTKKHGIINTGYYNVTAGAGNTATYNRGAQRADKLQQMEIELKQAFLEQLSTDPNIPVGALEALDTDLRLRSVVLLRILLRDPDVNKKLLAELTNMRLRGEDTWT